MLGITPQSSWVEVCEKIKELFGNCISPIYMIGSIVVIINGKEYIVKDRKKGLCDFK